MILSEYLQFSNIYNFIYNSISKKNLFMENEVYSIFN